MNSQSNIDYKNASSNSHIIFGMISAYIINNNCIFEWLYLSVASSE